ncbi:MAG: hypothetical protein HYZ81_02780 [Nitrospinae bacterium]|nr:hypothetical protein [Nitrospinota bacterium]
MSIRDEPRSLSSALLEMAQAYRQSTILIAACQLDVFTHLAHGPLGAEALAQGCGVPARGLRRLLNACVVVDLLEKEGDTYRNTPIADAFLVKGKPGYMGHFITLGSEQYEAWGRLIQAIREDGPVNPHSADALGTLPPERIQRYVEGLYDLGKRYGVAIADRVDLTHARQMLDVAGGSGIYSIIMAGQVSVRSCNYYRDDLGSGYDVVLLSNSLQTEGPQTCQMLLRKAFNGLVPGGQLFIHGVMPNSDRVSPPQPALFQMQMLLAFPEGDAYPAEEVCAWTQGAGFADLSVTPLPSPAFSTLITARKPA